MRTESPARSTFQIYANKVLTKLPGYNVINPVAGYKSPSISIVLDTVEIRVRGVGARVWRGPAGPGGRMTSSDW